MNEFSLESIMGFATFFLLLLICLLFFLLLLSMYKSFEHSKLSTKNIRKLEMLDQIFLNASVPALVINENGYMQYINDKATQIFGRPRAELEGTIFDAFTIVTSSKDKTRDMLKHFSKNERYTYEAQIAKRGKTRKSYEISLSQMSTGERPLILVGLSEITDVNSSKYEQDMKELRFNEVEIASGVGFFIYDHETREMIWSRGFYTLLGAKVNNVKPDLNFFNQFPPESLAQAQNLLLSFKSKKPVTEQLAVNGYDGKRRIIELTLKHEPTLGKNQMKTLGIGRDITETKKLADSVESNTNGWRRLYDLEKLIIATTDDSGTIKNLNKYGLKTVGANAEDVKGKNFREFFGVGVDEIKEGQPLKSRITAGSGNGDPSFIWQSFSLKNDKGIMDTLNFGIEAVQSGEENGPI